MEQLKARYPGKSQVTHMVVPDFTTGHAPFTEVVGERRFDDAVASHVIEHVPDFVGWLWNIWSVVKEKSVVSLAIPHAERTFDARRRQSSFGDAAEAYLGAFKRPSPAQIIDAQTGIAAFHDKPNPLKTAFEAFRLANHVRQTGHYVDMHCWVFTPDSWREILRTMETYGLLGFELLDVIDHGSDEFLVHLAKRPDWKRPDHLAL